MLTNLTLRNFKCFESLLLPLAPLTLLTGFNAAGKSTTLQSILLLAQSLRSGNRAAELSLNGPLTHLGTPGEILYSPPANLRTSARSLHIANGDVVFAFEDEWIEVEWALQAEDRSRGVAMRIHHVATKSATGRKVYSCKAPFVSLLPPGIDVAAISMVERLRETIFLSAVRQGTEDVFPSPEESMPIFADVGVQGEFAPWWFERLLDEDIEQARCNPKDVAMTLRRQFNAWASELFPGAQGNAQRVEKTNLLRLELRLGDTGDWRRPANIGYGLTYAFPIIVAGLLAKPGQIVIIDSPEAHLHPLGQSRIGRFLGQMAASGVQVIIETHSDHVLNGIRLAVQEELIKQEEVAIHFFNSGTVVAENIPRVVSPKIDQAGNLSEWPEGFFDQTERDLARLAGWQ